MNLKEESRLLVSPSSSGRTPQFGAVVPVILLAVLLAGLALRLIGISDPPFDSHGTRQCQTLSTIEDFYRNGIDLARPNTLYKGYPGTFVLELPLFQAMGAILYQIFGPHTEIVRLLNIFFGGITSWILYLLVKRCFNRALALITACLYWLAPLNAVYQRSTLLDPMAVCFALFSLYGVILLCDREQPESRNGLLQWVLWGAFSAAVLATALVKALYLWPAVLIFAKMVLDSRFRPNGRLTGTFAVFAISGMCFLAWNRHADLVNKASPFVGEISPMSHLGFSALIDPSFYMNLIVWRPRWWVGVIGVVAYPLGWYAASTERFARYRKWIWWFLAMPPSYLVLFANINRPHDYYQLIITPFLALTSAFGLYWLKSTAFVSDWFPKHPRALLAGAGALLVVVSVWTYAVWMKAPRTSSDLMTLQRLCAGKVEPWAPGMVLVSRSIAGPFHGVSNADYIYAAGVWGDGEVVYTDEEARNRFWKFSPAMPGLGYVVCYGLNEPDWLPDSFQPVLRDPEYSLFIFRRVPQ